MRLFVALHLEPEPRTRIEALQAHWQARDPEGRVRWVRSSGIHLTLAFLGEVDEPRLEPVEQAIASAASGQEAPRLGLGAPGAFPNLRRPRVLWVGLEEEGSRLAPLQQAVVSVLEPLGWEPDARAFQPHLTLGRVREVAPGRPEVLPAPLLEALTEPLARGPVVPHPRLALVRSHLSPDGAHYEDRRTWTLASG